MSTRPFAASGRDLDPGSEPWITKMVVSQIPNRLHSDVLLLHDFLLSPLPFKAPKNSDNVSQYHGSNPDRHRHSHSHSRCCDPSAGHACRGRGYMKFRRLIRSKYTDVHILILLLVLHLHLPPQSIDIDLHCLRRDVSFETFSSLYYICELILWYSF